MPYHLANPLHDFTYYACIVQQPPFTVKLFWWNYIFVGGGMVESNSNRFRDPAVFKTVLGPAQITLPLTKTLCYYPVILRVQAQLQAFSGSVELPQCL